MHIDQAIAEYNSCFYTHPNAIVLVWQGKYRYNSNLLPSHIGCSSCGEMKKIEVE